MAVSRFVTGVVVCLMLLAGEASAANGPASADDVANRVIGIIGGPAWDEARYFSFTFNVERDGKIAASYPQHWDRDEDMYRVSGRNKEGHDFVVQLNTTTRKGRAWLDGSEVSDPEALLTVGYKRFINDTYWLLMPLKMLDPGVTRSVEEKSDVCGRPHDVVKLIFAPNVGLTPADQYWAWVNRDTGIVDRWDMLLEGTAAGEAPTVVKFHDFVRAGGLLISTVREIVGTKSVIRLDDLVVSDSVPPDAFSPSK